MYIPKFPLHSEAGLTARDCRTILRSIQRERENKQILIMTALFSIAALVITLLVSL